MSTAVIADFSKTLTASETPSSWSAFEKSGILGIEYANARNRLYDEYHHFELEGNMEKTAEWFLEHARIFPEYELSMEIMKQLVGDDVYYAPRSGVSEFVRTLQDRKIPLFIVSSGFAEMIRMWFAMRDIATLDGVAIKANEFVIQDGRVTAFQDPTLMHPLGKPHSFDLSWYDYVFLLGDKVEDLDMYHGPNLVKTIGFAQGDVGYDVNLGPNGNLVDALTYIL